MLWYSLLPAENTLARVCRSVCRSRCPLEEIKEPIEELQLTFLCLQVLSAMTIQLALKLQLTVRVLLRF